MRRALKSGYRLSSRTQSTLLVLLTLGWLLMAVPGAILAVFAPLVFDRPGNLHNPVAWLGFGLGGLFWAVCLLSPALAWMHWRKGRRTRAWAAMAAPIAWAAAAVTVLQFVPG
ncbi:MULTISPECIES: hypothetical protein [unclassified Caulobacter]|uniref:hypothetical protein n=1 Tax=unclassified Caulobacter TaxID=2648921 RepID=UPI001E424B0A|nr:MULTISPECIES: hypothetical protein [unclassified Caulobacter]